MMVGIAAFIITVSSIFAFQGTGNLQSTSAAMVILIGLLTAIVSIFIELTGEKGCDNLTLPVGSGLFATLLLQFASVGFFVYLIITVIILITAYRFGSLTPDGIVAAFLTAVTLFTLGGPWLGISLLVFFILGSFISKLSNEEKQKAESLHEDSGARNWVQVVCNSLPACILV